MAWAPDYVTAADLKAYLRIGDAVDDAEIALAIAASSRAIDRQTNRQFGQDDIDTARYYASRYDRRIGRYVIDVDDLFDDPTEVVADNDDDETFDDVIDSFVLEPRNAVTNGFPFTRLVIGHDSTAQPIGVTRVTSRFGWAAVPDAIEQATLLQASRFFSRRDAPFGVAGSPEVGSEVRLLARVDPDVAVVVGPYVRWWGAA